MSVAAVAVFLLIPGLVLIAWGYELFQILKPHAPVWRGRLKAIVKWIASGAIWNFLCWLLERSGCGVIVVLLIGVGMVLLMQDSPGWYLDGCLPAANFVTLLYFAVLVFVLLRILRRWWRRVRDDLNDQR